MVTLLDVLLLGVFALAVLGGWRLGLTGFAFRLAGFAAGLLVGLPLADRLVPRGPSPLAHVALEALVVVVAALLAGWLGGGVGTALGALLTRLRLRPVDRIAGAVARGALAMVACWLLAGAVVALGPPAAARAVDRSVVLSRLAGALPPAGRLVDDVRRQLPPSWS